jgi:hypothetical protein
MLLTGLEFGLEFILALIVALIVITVLIQLATRCAVRSYFLGGRKIFNHLSKDARRLTADCNRSFQRLRN